jgi:phospholipid N-methyltransferase
MTQSTYSLLKEKTRYLQAFISSPRSFGSITPSSSSLCRRMSGSIDWTNTYRIAELGAGDGVLTRHLLQRMHTQAVLDAYEINPILASKLASLNDVRLQVHLRSAEDLRGKYDAIFSGLPLLSLSESLRHSILERASKALTPNGCFVQFQYTSLSESLLSNYFSWTRMHVIKNLPPAFIYHCTSKIN